MPPLYRMPVFYLVLIALGAISGLARLIGGAAPSPGESAVASDTAAIPLSVPEAAPPGTDPGDEDDSILRTGEGLRRKVLVRELGLRPRSSPDPKAPFVGPTLEYYAIQFVFDEADPPTPDAPRFLRVGPAEGPPIGWVPADAVLSWDTRLMARPTPRVGRPPLVIYRERSCLLDAIADRDCPRHDGPCPVEGEESDGSADPEGEAPALGLPILSSVSIPQPDGRDRTIFEVASLVADRSPPPPPPAEPPEHLRRLLRRVDIAFVIDTTASMQSYIEAARSLAADLAAEAARGDVILRLGLVAYRDHHPGFGYATRVVCPLAHPDAFRAALDGIDAASRGDGSVAEAVLDGVAAALPAPEGEPIGSAPHLSWPVGREGDLATKLLVLIGDAPDHDRDASRAEALARLARDHRITIAAVSIARDDLAGDEPDRYRSQWEALASGSFRPRDPRAGFTEPIPPVLPSLADAGALVPTLRALIADRFEYARELAALLSAEAEGRLRDYVDRRGLTLDQIAPVLVDLHGGLPRPEPKPDPRLDGVRAPSVRSGWIAESVAGHDLVTVEILMTRAELDGLIEELSQFQQALQAGATDLTDLLRIGTAAASGETAFLAADRGSRTFAEHLSRRRGLPPAPPDSLLSRSQAELLQADPPYRAAVEHRLSAALSALIQRRNARDWDDPDRTVSGMALVPYGPIDF
ncbi:VWA domain-containing protein [Tautonia sociabilis]|uniref:VWA domain-containing protein n=1 Tax=Tautonia sociabilis TaxID=2080755 RepID=A0A432MI78_9BACT|nr:vWA domain-containing protein [Tautonia sociabilis]RUL86832.1 VWA domain-containing protein [Tautonia sociabilis]